MDHRHGFRHSTVNGLVLKLALTLAVAGAKLLVKHVSKPKLELNPKPGLDPKVDPSKDGGKGPEPEGRCVR